MSNWAVPSSYPFPPSGVVERVRILDWYRCTMSCV